MYSLAEEAISRFLCETRDTIAEGTLFLPEYIRIAGRIFYTGSEQVIHPGRSSVSVCIIITSDGISLHDSE